MFRKFRWNVVFVVLLISVIGFIILDIIIYFNVRNYLFDQTFSEMRMKTDLAVNMVERDNLLALLESDSVRSSFASHLREIIDSRVTIIDDEGIVLYDTDVVPDSIRFMDNHIARPEVQEAIDNGWGQSYRRSATVNRGFFYTAFAIREGRENLGFIRLAYYAQLFDESMDKIKAYIVAANVVGLIALFFVAYSLGSLVTMPILRIVAVARRISEGDFGKSFPVERKDEVGKLAVILNQLTDRLQIQIRQISAERSKLQNILMNLDLGIIAVDDDRDILHINSETYRILKKEPLKTEKKSINELLNKMPIMKSLENTLTGNSKEIGEMTFYENEAKFFLSYIITPLYIAERQKSGALIQIQDTTALKQLEAIRKTFVANASHELKTPLTAIVGYTETLLDGTVVSKEDTMKFIRRINGQAQRLEFLVADLLKLSQLEHDLPLEYQNVDLVRLTRQVIGDLKDQSGSKKIEIKIETADQKAIVKADEELLRTVFSNLVDNAIKYTSEKGKIEVKLSDSSRNRLKVEVSDDGIGVDPKYQERIFQRFYRVDKGRSRALGGTGLGLAIVKHILDRHGSTISVRSRAGSGSCFCFELTKSTD